MGLFGVDLFLRDTHTTKHHFGLLFFLRLLYSLYELYKHKNHQKGTTYRHYQLAIVPFYLHRRET